MRLIGGKYIPNPKGNQKSLINDNSFPSLVILLADQGVRSSRPIDLPVIAAQKMRDAFVMAFWGWG
jgi:hypothetical protein